MNELSLAETARTTTSRTQTPRRFLDFTIDGEPLYPVVQTEGLDYITDLRLDGGDASVSAIGRLLGEIEPDAPLGRVCMYVCSECGDLGCGAITALVVEDSGVVTWAGWGFQNSSDDRVSDLVVGFPDVSFDSARYGAVLRAALGRFMSARTGD